jgi:uncharacterized protein
MYDQLRGNPALRYAAYAGIALAALSLLFVVRTVVKSYWEEYTDYVRRPLPQIARHPEKTGVAGLHEISFAAAGDPPLAAWYAAGANRAAIVLVHGVGGDRSSLLPEIKYLTDAGFGVLSLDLPGNGASEGKIVWGAPEWRAISAAVEWLSKRSEVDPQRIGAYGMSMGAYVLCQAAVADRRIQAVVLTASPHDVVEFNWVATARWGLLSQLPTYWALRNSGTPLDNLPKDIIGSIAPRPLLIINGDEDSLVTEWMARILYEAARDPKELYIVKGAHHGDYARVSPIEYRTHLVDFFNKTLAQRP